jgi:hypothetical protein
MENIVTANELKTKGVARIDEITSKGWPCRIDFSGALAAFIASSGMATSMSFRRSLTRLSLPAPFEDPPLSPVRPPQGACRS